MISAESIAAAYRNRLDPADPEARLLLADLADACGVGQSSYRPGDGPEATTFREGKRAVFLYVAGRLGLALDLGGLSLPQREGVCDGNENGNGHGSYACGGGGALDGLARRG